MQVELFVREFRLNYSLRNIYDVKGIEVNILFLASLKSTVNKL